MACALGVRADWEYGDRDHDDGGRFTVSFRGGVSLSAAAAMKNDLGDMLVPYCYYYPEECDGYRYDDTLGFSNIGAVPPTKKYEATSWMGGVAVGMVVPDSPNLRLELDWLHTGKSSYNSLPLFGDDENMVAAARMTSTTDAISAMIYFDMVGGAARAEKKTIPYFGIGLGYAISSTVLSMHDEWGELATNTDMQNYGDCSVIDEMTICDFYVSETETGNFALTGALGAAFWLGEGMYLDIGARATYIPKIRWSLNDRSGDGTVVRERDIISANDAILASFYAGLRFEF